MNDCSIDDIYTEGLAVFVDVLDRQLLTVGVPVIAVPEGVGPRVAPNEIDPVTLFV